MANTDVLQERRRVSSPLNEDGDNSTKTRQGPIQTKPSNRNMTKNETKTVMIARYGMLDCGKNYKGTASSNCSTCNVYDNENHRLNSCKKWNFNNPLDTDFSVDFNNIFSNDVNVLKVLIPYIQSVWNVKNGHGSIRTK